jgi:hypothetical protein
LDAAMLALSDDKGYTHGLTVAENGHFG